MYRQAVLRVPCVACGAEEALARMELSPRGGHWCWRCQLKAQIAAHTARTRGAPDSFVARGALIAVAAVVGILISGYALLWLYAAFAPRC